MGRVRRAGIWYRAGVERVREGAQAGDNGPRSVTRDRRVGWRHNGVGFGVRSDELHAFGEQDRPGLPATFSCESGSVSRELVMPQNAGKKAAKYKLTLEATGAGGNAKGKLTIEVGSAAATSISTGYGEACAVLSSSHVKCWGSGAGKAGKPADFPAEVAGISEAKEVAVGQGTCALLETGHIECWGSEERGSLGNGVAEGRSPTPVEVKGITTAVQLGGEASCALLSSGHVECWGNNYAGQLGTGISGSELEYSDVPVEVVGVADATQIAHHFPCVLLSSGHVECWGVNILGELGDGLFGKTADSDIPVEALGISEAAQVDGTCALLSSGHVDCWGENRDGQLGDGTNTGPEECRSAACSTVPVEVVGVTSASEVTQTENHACALLTDGHVECWGSNAYGQLGDGEDGFEKLSATPVQVVEVPDAVQIAAGASYTCALLSGGEVKCWGEGTQGQLGSRKIGKDETFSTGTPVEVAGI